MFGLSPESFRRPSDLRDTGNPAVLYVRSYLLVRLLVGAIGILLPFALIIGEGFIRGSVQVRGSLSAYYHTSMQDLYVGGLSVCAVLLAVYMAGQVKTWDFWLSLVAGISLVMVVFFPTRRIGLPHGAPPCGSLPEPAGCSPIEQAFGEGPVAQIHNIAAFVCILSLAAISFLFAYRERVHNKNLLMARVHVCCGVLILLAVTWTRVGGLLHANLGELAPLYLGEVVSVWAFGVSWMLEGKDLWALALPVRRRAGARSTVDGVRPAVLRDLAGADRTSTG